MFSKNFENCLFCLVTLKVPIIVRVVCDILMYTLHMDFRKTLYIRSSLFEQNRSFIEFIISQRKVVYLRMLVLQACSTYLHMHTFFHLFFSLTFFASFLSLVLDSCFVGDSFVFGVESNKEALPNSLHSHFQFIL